MGRQLGWKKSVLLICQALKVFVNALTAPEKYSLRIRDNLTQPIQMQLSQIEEFLSNFFLIFEIHIKF